MPGTGWCEQLAFVTSRSSFQGRVSGEQLSFTEIVTVVLSMRSGRDTTNSHPVDTIYTLRAVP